MTKKDSILLAGIGAVGSILYSRLLKKDYELVCLTSKRGTKQIRKKGISVKLTTDLSPKLLKAEVYEFLPSKYSFKYCIISTKAYNNRILAEYLPEFMKDDSSILLFQNGLGNEIPFIEQDKMWKITRAISSVASYRDKKDIVIENATGETMIGSINYESQEELDHWKDILNTIGLATIIPEDFEKALWMKAIVSSTLNPLGAISKLQNGSIIKEKQLLRVIGNVIDEFLLILKDQIELTYSDVFNYVLEVAKKTSENRCSMLQDFEKGVKTEIDFFNGYFLNLAKEKNIENPINKTLVSIIHKLSNKELPEELAILELRSLF